MRSWNEGADRRRVNRSAALLAVSLLLAVSACQAAASNLLFWRCGGDCDRLWELPRNATGPSGVARVVVTRDTDADLPTAVQQFRSDTLITSNTGAAAATQSVPALFLGRGANPLSVASGVTLTIQGLKILNVLASVSPAPAAPPSSPNAAAPDTAPAPPPSALPLSLSLDSFSLSRGSLLRLVRCELVLADCAEAANLHAAAGEAGGGGLTWNATRGPGPQVNVTFARFDQLELHDTVVKCNQLCGTDRVRVMQASSREEWDAALAAAGSRADNCSAYRIELLDSIALAAEDEEQELIPSGSGAGGLAAAAVDLATAQRIGGRSLLLSAAAEGRAEAARSWRKLAWDRAEAAAWAAAARQPRNARAPTTRTASPSHEQLQRASHTSNSVLTDRDGSARNRRRLTGAASTPAPVSLTSPVTIRGMGSPVLGRDSGRRGAAVVLDLGLLRSALVLGGPEARLTLESVVLTNLAAPHPGVLSLPLYWVSRPSARADAGGDPWVTLVNVTLVVPPDELSYLSTWLSHVLSGVGPLAADTAAWLRAEITSAELTEIAPTALQLRTFSAFGIRATNLRITSSPPPESPQALTPSTGLSLVAPTPQSTYPQVVLLNSTQALIAVLNASSGQLPPSPAPGAVAYPGCPTLATIALMPPATTPPAAPAPNTNTTTPLTTYSLARPKPLLLNRSYILSGPAPAPSSSSSPPPPPITLDFGRASAGAWASLTSSSSSHTLTLMYVTLVGLDSPSRWPAPALVRCLDLPLWALEAGSRLPSLEGEPPALVLAGATVAVSRQELGLWAACYQVLGGREAGSDANSNSGGNGSSNAGYRSELVQACEGLGLTRFQAERAAGSSAIFIKRLQGAGVDLQNVTLRDDIAPYNRSDLDALLAAPGPPPSLPSPGGLAGVVASLPPGGGDDGASFADGKWKLAAGLAGATVGVSALAVAILVLRERWCGKTRYINVHMRKNSALKAARVNGNGKGFRTPPASQVTALSRMGTGTDLGAAGSGGLARGSVLAGLGTRVSSTCTVFPTSLKHKLTGRSSSSGQPVVAVADGNHGANGSDPTGVYLRPGTSPDGSAHAVRQTAPGLALGSAMAVAPTARRLSGALSPPPPAVVVLPGTGPALQAAADKSNKGSDIEMRPASPTGSAGSQGRTNGRATMARQLLQRAGSGPHSLSGPAGTGPAAPMLPRQASADGKDSGPEGGSHEQTTSGQSATGSTSSSAGGAPLQGASSNTGTLLPPMASAAASVVRPSMASSSFSRLSRSSSSVVHLQNGSFASNSTMAFGKSSTAIDSPLHGLYPAAAAAASMQLQLQLRASSSPPGAGGKGTALLVPGHQLGTLQQAGGVLQHQRLSQHTEQQQQQSQTGAEDAKEVAGQRHTSVDGRAAKSSHNGSAFFSSLAAAVRRPAGSSPGFAARPPDCKSPQPAAGRSKTMEDGNSSADGERGSSLNGDESGATSLSKHSRRRPSGRSSPFLIAAAESAEAAAQQASRKSVDGGGSSGPIAAQSSCSNDSREALNSASSAFVQAAADSSPPPAAARLPLSATQRFLAAIAGGGSTAGSGGGSGAGGVAPGSPPLQPLPSRGSIPRRATDTCFSRPSLLTSSANAAPGTAAAAAATTPAHAPLAKRSSAGVLGLSTGSLGFASVGGASGAANGSAAFASNSNSGEHPLSPGRSPVGGSPGYSTGPSPGMSRTGTNLTAAGAAAGDAASAAPSAGGAGGGGGAAAAKPGLGRLLVGSLSSMFRVDSLTGGAREGSVWVSGQGAGGGGAAGGSRHVAGGGGAMGKSDSGRSVAGIPGLRNQVASAAAAGGVAGGAAAGAVGLEAALSELTASVEGRLQENQLVIQQALGSGAFGTVYKGLWKGLAVAVKTMTLTSDAVTQGKHAALMEAALSKSIFHPHVVTTYTCDLKPMHVDASRVGAMTGLAIMNETEVIQEWRLYIVQEFCDGGSLRHAIEARSFLNPATGGPQLEWVLQMAREIAAGMQYLHEHNIVHGDLNPANVLLKRDDASVLGYAAKIADFGLSVHMHAEQSHVSNTKRGTPFYTAPEVTNAGNLTRFADVFSYGVVLWELYMSRSCWTYGAGGRLVHQRGFPHLPPTCPRSFASLVTSCMQPAHKQRPTFKQVGITLEAMQRELGRAGGPQDPWAVGQQQHPQLLQQAQQQEQDPRLLMHMLMQQQLQHPQMAGLGFPAYPQSPPALPLPPTDGYNAAPAAVSGAGVLGNGTFALQQQQQQAEDGGLTRIALGGAASSTGGNLRSAAGGLDTSAAAAGPWAPQHQPNEHQQQADGAQGQGGSGAAPVGATSSSSSSRSQGMWPPQAQTGLLEAPVVQMANRRASGAGVDFAADAASDDASTQLSQVQEEGGHGPSQHAEAAISPEMPHGSSTMPTLLQAGEPGQAAGGVAGGFQLHTDAPRFAAPDLPTVVEADELLSSCASQACKSSTAGYEDYDSAIVRSVVYGSRTSSVMGVVMARIGGGPQSGGSGFGSGSASSSHADLGSVCAGSVGKPGSSGVYSFVQVHGVMDAKGVAPGTGSPEPYSLGDGEGGAIRPVVLDVRYPTPGVHGGGQHPVPSDSEGGAVQHGAANADGINALPHGRATRQQAAAAPAPGAVPGPQHQPQAASRPQLLPPPPHVETEAASAARFVRPSLGALSAAALAEADIGLPRPGPQATGFSSSSPFARPSLSASADGLDLPLEPPAPLLSVPKPKAADSPFARASMSVAPPAGMAPLGVTGSLPAATLPTQALSSSLPSLPTPGLHGPESALYLRADPSPAAAPADLLPYNATFYANTPSMVAAAYCQPTMGLPTNPIFATGPDYHPASSLSPLSASPPPHPAPGLYPPAPDPAPPLPLRGPADALNADPDHPRFSRATHGRRHEPHDLTPDLPGPAFAPQAPISSLPPPITAAELLPVHTFAAPASQPLVLKTAFAPPYMSPAELGAPPNAQQLHNAALAPAVPLIWPEHIPSPASASPHGGQAYTAVVAPVSLLTTAAAAAAGPSSGTDVASLAGAVPTTPNSGAAKDVFGSPLSETLEATLQPPAAGPISSGSRGNSGSGLVRSQSLGSSWRCTAGPGSPYKRSNLGRPMGQDPLAQAAFAAAPTAPAATDMTWLGHVAAGWAAASAGASAAAERILQGHTARRHVVPRAAGSPWTTTAAVTADDSSVDRPHSAVTIPAVPPSLQLRRFSHPGISAAAMPAANHDVVSTALYHPGVRSLAVAAAVPAPYTAASPAPRFDRDSLRALELQVTGPPRADLAVQGSPAAGTPNTDTSSDSAGLRSTRRHVSEALHAAGSLREAFSALRAAAVVAVGVPRRTPRSSADGGVEAPPQQPAAGPEARPHASPVAPAAVTAAVAAAQPPEFGRVGMLVAAAAGAAAAGAAADSPVVPGSVAASAAWLPMHGEAASERGFGRQAMYRYGRRSDPGAEEGFPFDLEEGRPVGGGGSMRRGRERRSSLDEALRVARLSLSTVPESESWGSEAGAGSSPVQHSGDALGSSAPMARLSRRSSSTAAGGRAQSQGHHRRSRSGGSGGGFGGGGAQGDAGGGAVSSVHEQEEEEQQEEQQEQQEEPQKEQQ